MNLAQLVADRTRSHPGDPAVRAGDLGWDRARLDAAVRSVSAALRGRGIAPGDRVVVDLPNSAAFVAAYYAVLRAGGVVVPVSPLLTRDERAEVVDAAGARVVVDDPVAARDLMSGATAGLSGDPAPAVDPVPRDDGDLAVLLFTSGSTGRPKGVCLTHGGLRADAEAYAAATAVGPGDRVFGGLPLFHAFGQTCALNATLLAGGSVSLLGRFDPAAAWRILARDRITVCLGVPAMYVAMLDRLDPGEPEAIAADLSALRLAVSGGAPLPADLPARFAEATGAPLHEGYGLSEASPVVTVNRADRPARPGTVGIPLRGTEIRVTDGDGRVLGPEDGPGELCVRGPGVMAGYWHDAAATARAIRDGWLHTGDLARIDDDGYCTIVGRAKDVILRNGHTIHPRPLEAVLEGHPAVAEAAVVGVPDRRRGEEIVAVVALRPGAEAGEDELRDWARARLAAFEYPRVVEIRASLPHGPSGKLLRRAIRPRSRGDAPHV